MFTLNPMEGTDCLYHFYCSVIGGILHWVVVSCRKRSAFKHCSIVENSPVFPLGCYFCITSHQGISRAAAAEFDSRKCFGTCKQQQNMSAFGVSPSNSRTYNMSHTKRSSLQTRQAAGNTVAPGDRTSCRLCLGTRCPRHWEAIDWQSMADFWHTACVKSSATLMKSYSHWGWLIFVWLEKLVSVMVLLSPPTLIKYSVANWFHWEKLLELPLAMQQAQRVQTCSLGLLKNTSWEMQGSTNNHYPVIKNQVHAHGKSLKNTDME